MKRFTVLLLAVICALLVGCTAQPTASPSATAVPTHTQPVPSDTPIPPTQIPSIIIEYCTGPWLSDTLPASEDGEFVPTTLPAYLGDVYPTGEKSILVYNQYLSNFLPIGRGVGVELWVDDVGIAPENRGREEIKQRIYLCVDGEWISNDQLKLGDGMMVSLYDGGAAGPYYLSWAPPLDPGLHEAKFLLVNDAGEVLEYTWQFTLIDDTSTTVPNTDTIMPTPSATQVTATESPPVSLCSTAAPGKQPDFPGTLFYWNSNQEIRFTIDAALSPVEQPVPVSFDYWFLGFSPDGQWQAYIEIMRRDYGENLPDASFLMISSSGEMIEHQLNLSGFEEQVPLDLYLAGNRYGGWINNQLIYAPLLMYSLSVGSRHFYTLPKILDPFSGLWREDLLINIPSFTPTPEGRYAINLEVGFSPDMTRVLYEYTNPKTYARYPVIWNLEESSMVWEDETISTDQGLIVTWSPDNSMVAFIPFEEAREYLQVYMIGREGENLRVVANAEYPLSDVRYTSISWSPDSRYLAISGQSIYYESPIQPVLLVFDRIEDRLILQCPFGDVDDYPSSIYWSPDSRFLVPATYPDSKMIMIDILSLQAYPLGVEGAPIGWLSDGAISQP